MIRWPTFIGMQIKQTCIYIFYKGHFLQCISEANKHKAADFELFPYVSVCCSYEKDTECVLIDFRTRQLLKQL